VCFFVARQNHHIAPRMVTEVIEPLKPEKGCHIMISRFWGSLSFVSMLDSWARIAGLPGVFI
jgi:hypothetical protein